MNGDQTLSRDELMGLLTEVGAELHHDGLHGDLYLVGGAAIALTLDTRRLTEDVDVMFRSARRDVRSAAAEVAARHGLQANWINAGAAAFVPDEEDPNAVTLDVPGLSISVASPEHLLAMKMIAARPGRDWDDLVLLFEHLGITEAQQALDIAQRLYGDNDVIMADPPESYLYLARDVLRLMGRRSEAGGAARPADPARWSAPPDGDPSVVSD